ncbi:MAG: hypothetical protein EXR74_05125 [Bdellovibrionales bacterium]|nr:hypothetical protein [Bdellovibrionales bacterium]
MELKTQKELAKAKSYFYQLKLIEAYNILRRYFDRLPFKPEKEHAEFIGMFVRILSELGKNSELSFYSSALQKLEKEIESPSITYQLAVVYVNADPPLLKLAIPLLEKLIRTSIAADYEAKAKMTLAYCYDEISNDVAAVRQLIYSIPTSTDLSIQFLIETWKVKIYRDEKNFVEAEKTLKNLLLRLTPEIDWYAYFTAQIIAIGLYQDSGNMNLAKQLLIETAAMAQEKPLKTVKRQLESIQKAFITGKEIGPLVLELKKGHSVLTFLDQMLILNETRLTDKLTLCLLRQKTMTKEEIITALFNRDYAASTDNALIYYHVHGVKKNMKKIGVDTQYLEKKGIHYIFTGEVQLIEEAL